MSLIISMVYTVMFSVAFIGFAIAMGAITFLEFGLLAHTAVVTLVMRLTIRVILLPFPQKFAFAHFVESHWTHALSYQNIISSSSKFLTFGRRQGQLALFFV